MNAEIQSSELFTRSFGCIYNYQFGKRQLNLNDETKATVKNIANQVFSQFQKVEKEKKFCDAETTLWIIENYLSEQKPMMEKRLTEITGDEHLLLGEVYYEVRERFKDSEDSIVDSSEDKIVDSMAKVSSVIFGLELLRNNVKEMKEQQEARAMAGLKEMAEFDVGLKTGAKLHPEILKEEVDEVQEDEEIKLDEDNGLDLTQSNGAEKLEGKVSKLRRKEEEQDKDVMKKIINQGTPTLLQ